jgi:putative protein-disulfide isomerase
VIPHHQRIAQITGQPLGKAYFEGLLHDTSAVFDSGPPIAATLAAEKIADRGLDTLSRLQSAHYVEGRRIANREVLVEMAGAIGLDAAAFVQALNEIEGEEVNSHIAETFGFNQQHAEFSMAIFPPCFLPSAFMLRRSVAKQGKYTGVCRP